MLSQDPVAGDKLTRTGTNDSLAFLKYVAADSSRRQTVTSNLASAAANKNVVDDDKISATQEAIDNQVIKIEQQIQKGWFEEPPKGAYNSNENDKLLGEINAAVGAATIERHRKTLQDRADLQKQDQKMIETQTLRASYHEPLNRYI